MKEKLKDMKDKVLRVNTHLIGAPEGETIESTLEEFSRIGERLDFSDSGSLTNSKIIIKKKSINPYSDTAQ